MTEEATKAANATQGETAEEICDFLDVPMNVRLEVGRRRAKVSEILLLRNDAVVEIPKSAGENVDIYINGSLVAFGEILEMEGKAGVRLTDFVENK